MLESLRASLRRHEMVSSGDTVVCAVSGGADSMALLWGFYLLKDSLGITLQAAHFNHGLRGVESDRDEAHVRAFCERFDIPLTVGRGEIVPGKKGLEAAAREARYGFLESLPGKIGTAHTADDNAETVLMHLVRGTGLKGLGGIAPVRGRVIRPMLDITRRQVVEFLQEYHVGFVTDSSNETDAFLRNRLRHHVMPLLKKENPRLAVNLSAMAQRLRQDEEALDIAQDFSKGLSLEKLRSLPPAKQSRLVAAFLKHCGVKEPDAKHIRQVLALVESDSPSASADLPGGAVIARQYERLVLQAEIEEPEEKRLSVPGRVLFGGTSVEASLSENGERVAVEGKITVRSRLPGDRIRLGGGTKSLKKLFIDRKIPAQDRPKLAVVADEKGVLAVEGVGCNHSRLVQNGEGVQIIFRKERENCYAE